MNGGSTNVGRGRVLFTLLPLSAPRTCIVRARSVQSTIVCVHKLLVYSHHPCVPVAWSHARGPCRDGIFGCYAAGAQFQPTLATTPTQRGTCQAADVLSAEKRQYLKTVVLPAALEFFQDTLSVTPVVGNLMLDNPIADSDCCNPAWQVCNSFVCCRSYTPTADMTNGVSSSDFHLYVTARPTGGSTIAWALACQYDQNARPIAGHINFNPSRISTVASDFHSQLTTA
ncbi:hypothetical protein EON62_04960, partial [archaeon]